MKVMILNMNSVFHKNVKRFLIAFITTTLLTLTNCAAADNVPEQPDSELVKTAAESNSADQLAELSKPLQEILKKVDAAGDKYKDIQSSLVYTEKEVIFGERSTYTGKVYYSKDADSKQPASFRIHLDKLRAGGRTSQEDRDYVFSSDSTGQWFTTRNARIKQIVKYHIAPPGEKTDPLALGKGPFPIPFGQDSAEVAKMFTLSMRELTEGEPENTTCVKLVPKGDNAEKLSVKSIEMWINADGLPVRIRIDDLAGEVTKTAEFRKIKTDTKIDSDTYKLPWPGTLSGWERRIEPLPEKQDK